MQGCWSKWVRNKSTPVSYIKCIRAYSSGICTHYLPPFPQCCKLHELPFQCIYVYTLCPRGYHANTSVCVLTVSVYWLNRADCVCYVCADSKCAMRWLLCECPMTCVWVSSDLCVSVLWLVCECPLTSMCECTMCICVLYSVCLLLLWALLLSVLYPSELIHIAILPPCTLLMCVQCLHALHFYVYIAFMCSTSVHCLHALYFCACIASMCTEALLQCVSCPHMLCFSVSFASVSSMPMCTLSLCTLLLCVFYLFSILYLWMYFISMCPTFLSVLPLCAVLLGVFYLYVLYLCVYFSCTFDPVTPFSLGSCHEKWPNDVTLPFCFFPVFVCLLVFLYFFLFFFIILFYTNLLSAQWQGKKNTNELYQSTVSIICIKTLLSLSNSWYFTMKSHLHHNPCQISQYH